MGILMPAIKRTFTNSFSFRGAWAFFFAVLIVGSYLWGNVTNPFFWFDAAGQLFMALGMDPCGPPFAEIGSFWNSLKLNLGGNMDPGMFTILVRYWAFISTHPAWLRILPLLFLLAALVLIFRLTIKATNDLFLSAVLAFFPLTNPLIAQWGLSLRGYAMEMCGAVLASLLCYEPEVLKDKRRLIGAVLLLGFFAGSRYSFLLVIFSLGAALAITRFEELRLKISKRMIAFGSLALLPIAIPLSMHAQTKVTYISRFVLAGKTPRGFFDIVLANLSRPEVLLQIVFVLVYSALLKGDPIKRRHQTFLYFLIFVNIAFIAVSIIGVYPWVLDERYTISLNIVSYVAAASAVSIIASKLEPRKALSAGGYAALCAIQALAVSNFKLDTYTNTYDSLEWAKSEGLLENRVSFLSRGAQIDARYLFEHGYLKGKWPEFYPGGFIANNSDQAPDAKTLSGIDHAFIATADYKMLAYFKQHPDFEPLKEYNHLRIFKRKRH
ncbi:MAG: hypothetical protein A2X94_01795 [Bdellovibrionales bacterium GWB1_55_8]|nr:MAG: hypothetical protein A2X94_01795 [Bdellovibrionales bacterium GWB1_55_8]